MVKERFNINCNYFDMEFKPEVLHMDCMEAMKKFPDKFFDLAIVDPPYGIGVNHNMGRRKGDKPSDYKPAYWDKEAPHADYFNALIRVSKNQIVWGANHFISKMPFDSSCWLLWDKCFSEDVSFAQYEMAWTSFDSVCRKYDKPSQQSDRIHPTQKPISLYKWLLHNYAKCPQCNNEKRVVDDDFDRSTIPCETCNGSFKILDTHLGSGSSRIAAHDMGFEFWGYEIDKDYFESQEKRFKQHISQLTLSL